MERRIFLAILIPPRLQDAIVKWEKNWQSANRHAPARWVSVKNLHVTVVPPWYTDDVGGVIKKLQTLEHRMPPFEIRFEKITYGPHHNTPRLIWIEGKTPHEIVMLKSLLETTLHLPSQNRPFLLHLTLARFHATDFSAFPIKTLNEPVSWRFKAEDFVIMESHLSFSGAEYGMLKKFTM